MSTSVHDSVELGMRYGIPQVFHPESPCMFRDHIQLSVGSRTFHISQFPKLLQYCPTFLLLGSRFSGKSTTHTLTSWLAIESGKWKCVMIDLNDSDIENEQEMIEFIARKTGANNTGSLVDACCSPKGSFETVGTLVCIDVSAKLPKRLAEWWAMQFVNMTRCDSAKLMEAQTGVFSTLDFDLSTSLSNVTQKPRLNGIAKFVPLSLSDVEQHLKNIVASFPFDVAYSNESIRDIHFLANGELKFINELALNALRAKPFEVLEGNIPFRIEKIDVATGAQALCEDLTNFLHPQVLNKDLKDCLRFMLADPDGWYSFPDSTRQMLWDTAAFGRRHLDYASGSVDIRNQLFAKAISTVTNRLTGEHQSPASPPPKMIGSNSDEFIESVLSSPDPCKTIAKFYLNYTQAHAVAVYSSEIDGLVLECFCKDPEGESQKFGKHLLTQFIPRSEFEKDSLASACFHNAPTFVSPDDLPGLSETLRFELAASYPLSIGGETHGLLVLFSDRPSEFFQRSITFIEASCSMVATLLTSTSLIESSTEHTTQSSNILSSKDRLFCEVIDIGSKTTSIHFQNDSGQWCMGEIDSGAILDAKLAAGDHFYLKKNVQGEYISVSIEKLDVSEDAFQHEKFRSDYRKRMERFNLD